MLKNVLLGLSISLLVLASILPLSAKTGAPEESKSKVAISCCYRNSPCGTGAAMLLTGMGDPYGKPLQLEYRESIAPNDASEWQSWHKAIEHEINVRLEQVKERIKADDKLLVCEISCNVTQDGKIVNLRVEGGCPPEPFHSRISPDCPLPAFEQLALQKMSSLEGSPLLKFPSGATVTDVNVSGRFSQNYGPKFKKTLKEGSQAP